MIRTVLTAALLTYGIALGQTAPAPAEPMAFEVVSIHPGKPGPYPILSWTTTPDGYLAPAQSLWFTIMIAYFPQNMAYWSGERISGAPAWIDDLYSINAKVSEADLAEWQKQGMALNQKVILDRMLKTMLADRFHLITHFVPGGTMRGFSLEVGKYGPHLPTYKPDESVPLGYKLPNGGIVVPWTRAGKPRLSYYDITMTNFAQQLSQTFGIPIQDHTGLSGQYDVIADWVDDPDSTLRPGVISSDDPEPLSHYDFDSLGLRVTPIKVPIDTLVIDHIQKPSEN